MLTDLFTSVAEADNQSRQLKQKGRIIKHLAISGGTLTLPQIARHLRTSIPTVTNLVQELIAEHWILEAGKKETENGRKPSLYQINRDKGYSGGLEIGLKGLRLIIMRLDGTIAHEATFEKFNLLNNQTSLDILTAFIEAELSISGIPYQQFLGFGVGITGRVNSETGESLNFLNFMEVPLRKYLTSRFSIPFFIDNDTRAMGLAEQVFGSAKSSKNALIVNVGRGLGLSMILNKRLVTGSSGFAGELGHMQLGQNDRLCICGKKGCLETEVSGAALEKDLEEALNKKERSLYFSNEEPESYSFRDILNASFKGDALSIELLQAQGQRLGEALGSLVNLFNPELIVIGGELAKGDASFLDAIPIGIKKTALLHPLKQCKIIPSKLNKDTVALGAAAMILRNHELI